MKMKKLAGKTSVILSAGILAISLSAATSFAGDKLVVQDSSQTDVFKVDDLGNVGFNIAAPNYAADVVSKGNASKSQLHFSLDGSDSGGWLTSVLENNFWVSSGGVFDSAAGGWIQKAASGKSVFFGSGDAGFKAYMNQGNTPGQVMTNLYQVMVVGYDGSLTMKGGIQMSADTAGVKPACNATTRGMLYMTRGTTDAVQICAQKGGALGWYNVSF